MSEPSAEVEELERQLAREAEITRAFSPAAPVDRRDLFAGRGPQMRTLMEAVNGRGEHAVIYGERGVGKTSLAAVGALIAARSDLIALKVNCAEADTFEAIWQKVLSKITFTHSKQAAGFTAEVEEIAHSAAERLPSEPSAQDIEMALGSVAQVVELAVFIDEFDRVADADVHAKMADAIKGFSDQGIRITVVLVGVADDVGQLIAEHQSIERGLTQVHMPRMSPAELTEIINRGLAQVGGMSISPDLQARIARLSQGLPHYTHLLAQEAAKAAIWDQGSGASSIRREDVFTAMATAVKRSPQTLTKNYHSATSSSRGKTLYPDVLLAAALTQGDDLGYFAAGDVREPLRAITKRALDIPAFSPHLHTLCEADRGAVLQRTGSPRRYRFRFANPLMQPYVIMRALTEEGLSDELLQRFLAG